MLAPLCRGGGSLDPDNLKHFLLAGGTFSGVLLTALNQGSVSSKMISLQQSMWGNPPYTHGGALDGQFFKEAGFQKPFLK